MTNRDASDWDPLPEDETGMHPGEASAAKPAATSGAPARPGAVVASPWPGASAKAPSALGNKGLLDQRDASPPSSMLLPAREGAPQAPGKSAESNLLRSLQRPEARAGLESIMASPVAAPKPRAAARVAAALLVPVELPSAGPIPGRDPREQSGWFLAMPVVEQVRLQRSWQNEFATGLPGVDSDEVPQKSQQLLERFWVAYVVFFIAALPLMLSEGLSSFVRMAMAGCITGMLWQVLPHTRKWCTGSAVGVYLGVAMLPRTTELLASPFELLVALGGALLVGYTAGLGVTHEERLRQPVAD